MLFLRKDPSSESQYHPDDTIFKTDSTKMMKLPGESGEVFEELQVFNQVWIWAFMGAETLLVLLPLVLAKVAFPALAIAALVMLLTMVLISSIKLRTRIDDEGVHFRMNVFQWKERTIPWPEIDRIYVRQYSPLKEYGGWGIRKGKNGWAYTLSGKYGIQIGKKDGKEIMIGTRQPESAKEYLSGHPLLV
jgi:hypothetical protein